MSTVQELVFSSDHLQIIQLDDSFASYKCIAYIHLEKYQEAIKYASPNSFEFFYCLYKLKRFKKCVRGINKLKKKSDAINVVLAQSLYYLGYYYGSYKVLEKIKNTGTPINLKATLSLLKASKSNITHRFAVHSKDYSDDKFDENLLKRGALDDDELLEYEFNECFENLTSEAEYVKALESKVNNILCMIQLNNITGNYEEINPEILSKRQREIMDANREDNELVNPVHFQAVNKEYNIIKEVCRNGISYQIVNKLHGDTEKLNILKVYSDMKRGSVDEKRINRVKDEKIRKLLLFLNSGKVDDIKGAMEMIDDIE